MKSKDADKKVFAFQPKAFQLEASAIAKEFVERENAKGTDFLVSEIVSETTKIRDLRKKDSEALIEDAVLTRMKEIEEEAYQKAYELGLIEGEKKAFEIKSAEIKSSLESLNHAVGEFGTLKTQLLQQNEVFFIKLIFQTASRIALKEIAESREPLAEFLKQIIEGVEGDDRVLVHLAEQDYAFFQDLQARQGSESSFNRVKLTSSTTIEAGGCVVESNFGTIDASVPKRVEKVWGALEAKLPHLKGHHVNLVADTNEVKPDKKDDNS
ncbi:MAG: FliH/SctL family protein [Bdellovibrionota bacterium]